MSKIRLFAAALLVAALGACASPAKETSSANPGAVSGCGAKAEACCPVTGSGSSMGAVSGCSTKTDCATSCSGAASMGAVSGCSTKTECAPKASCSGGASMGAVSGKSGGCGSAKSGCGAKAGCGSST